MKIEPNADLRVAARQIFELYTALVDEGFTEEQALVLIGQVMAGAMGNG